MALLGDLTYRIAHRSDEKHAEYGHLIYTVKQSMAFTRILPIFTKLVIAKRLQVEIFSTRFRPYW